MLKSSSVACFNFSKKMRPVSLPGEREGGSQFSISSFDVNDFFYNSKVAYWRLFSKQAI